MTAELIGIAVLAVVVFAVLWPPLRKYTSRRVAESQRLADEGWICVGWDFIAGPIMVPPEAVFPPELAKKARQIAKEQRQ